jgi:hypothetical protein
MAGVYRYDRDVLQIRILIVFIPNSSVIEEGHSQAGHPHLIINTA